jgi:hypothetical protein
MYVIWQNSKIMNSPVQSRHLPAHGPIAVASPPTTSLAPPFHTPSYTQRHPVPPLWASPNGAPPCTPGATPVKTVPVASYRASGSPQAVTGSTLNHRHDTAHVIGTHVGRRVKCAGAEVWSTGDTCGALTPCGTRVTGAPRNMPTNDGKKDSPKGSPGAQWRVRRKEHP